MGMGNLWVSSQFSAASNTQDLDSRLDGANHEHSELKMPPCENHTLKERKERFWASKNDNSASLEWMQEGGKQREKRDCGQGDTEIKTLTPQ